jgi:hypothetical protein
MSGIQRSARLVAAMVLSVASAGCSVVRSATSDPGVDVSIVAVGAPRTQIEERLGSPVRAWSNDSGTAFRTYQYDAGREASFGDATGCAFMDVATVFLWELFIALDPEPAIREMRRITRRVVVSYGADGAVLGTFEEFAALPADGRVPPGTAPWTPVPPR